MKTVGTLIKARVLLLDLAGRLPRRKRRRSARVASFERALHQVWGEALATLEELIASCAELGDLTAQLHAEKTELFFVLELLRTRAYQVAWEVHTLAASGYADGAYARWRTLHEIAVVTEFLRKNGNPAAVAYLEHAQIKNRKIFREYSECQVELGYEPIPECDIEAAEQKKRGIIEKYGETFAKDYGWAAPFCESKEPSFVDIRKASGYGHWKAHFGMANHAVHAGPHGVLFRLGHPIGSKPAPLIGPSLVGLCTPLHATSISLMYATFSYVMQFRDSPRESITQALSLTARMKYIQQLSSRVGAFASKAHDRMEAKYGSQRAV
jgi:hypothetical protein